MYSPGEGEGIGSGYGLGEFVDEPVKPLHGTTVPYHKNYQNKQVVIKS